MVSNRSTLSKAKSITLPGVPTTISTPSYIAAFEYLYLHLHTRLMNVHSCILLAFQLLHVLVRLINSSRH